MKSNLTYIFYNTFSSDLLFWIVINNLFLTTTKGMSEFNIILITLLGLAFSLILYPLVSLIMKKISNHASIIIGQAFFIVSILFFTFCNTIYSFVVAQIIYSIAISFKQASTLMLKNNLRSQGKEDSFVKWKSFAKLGYATITTIIAAVAGIFFNINAFLPMYLSIACAVIGFIFAILYNEPKLEKSEIQEVQQPVKLKKIILNKMMILIFLMNLITVGTYTFFHTKSTLLLQLVCKNAHLQLATISLIVSSVVLASRIMRAIANFVTPLIYKKTKKKPKLILGISIAVLLSGVLYALGGNLKTNVIVNIVLITFALLIVVSIRDLYSTLENKMIMDNLPGNEQKQALLLGNVYGNFGRLLLNSATLLALSFTSLNVAYLFLLIFAIGQIFICIPLSKYLSENEEKTNESQVEKQD